MGNMEQYANPDSESRAVGDHAIPAVEEVMTDELLCARCGYARESAEHDGFETDIIRDVLLPGPRHPFGAAPSTDEGEARWERGEESPDIVVWRAVRREVLPYVEMPKSLEAAIRAPLEAEIVREKSHCVGQMMRAQAAEERIRELEAGAGGRHEDLGIKLTKWRCSCDEKAEQEAERRWPSSTGSSHGLETRRAVDRALRSGFIKGAEWALEQHRELLEAAEAYRDELGAMNSIRELDGYVIVSEPLERAKARLLAAAAALDESGTQVPD